MIKSLQNSKKTYINVTVFMLCLLPIIAVLAPRALGFLPAVLGLVGFLAYRPVFGQKLAWSRSVFGWFSGLVLLAGVSALWAVDPPFSIERTWKIAVLFLGGGLLLSFDFSLLKGLFQKFFPAIFVLAAALCAYELYFDGVIYRMLHAWPVFDERLNLAVYNRSVSFLILCFWPTLSLLESRVAAPKQKMFFIGLVFSLVLIILAKTESQSAQLAFLAGGLFYYGFPVRRVWAWQGFVALLLAALWSLPWLMPFLFNALPDKIGGIEWLRHSYASERLEIWDFISRRIQENPFYGFGIESTRAIQDFDTAQMFHKGHTILHPHNFALQIWIEFGVLGIAMFSAFFIKLVNYFKAKPAPVSRLFLATFVSILSIASTGYGFWQSWWLGGLFLVAAFCLIAEQAYKEKGG